ncbi:matrixin family metalloprotease [Paenibacillus thailandensis]|uniref:Matrixin family metalloprotease n=1 Tax=Paenibacillus thailandensis TaxID=393250 RepID=A0ABW5QYK3_9BACL
MKNKKLLVTASAVLASISLLVSSTPASATVTSFGKWSNRTQTMYIATSSANSTAWSSGAAKWKSNTNFNVSTKLGTSSIYYAYDVNDSSVTWDGICTYTTRSGIITKATLQLNTYYTNQSKYTSSIKAGVTGHEVGHSLGLNHTSAVETSSIMYPNTFNSDGTPARSVNPSSSDISVVNNLYPVLPTATATGVGSKGDGVYLHASWSVGYKNKEELTKAADLVVKGTVSKEKGSKFGKKGDYSTYSTEVNVEISEVLKGDPAQEGQNITVSQMGGTDGEVTVYSDSSTHLRKNQEIMLFLREVNGDTYIPINEDDSIFVNEGGSFKNIASKKELE